jgi:hypothetical protein
MPSFRSKHHRDSSKNDDDLDGLVATSDVHDTTDVLETEVPASASESTPSSSDETVTTSAEAVDAERSIADALSPIASSTVPDVALFSDIVSTLRDHINSIKGINIEYVLLGIAIAIYLPALAWLALAYLFALPSLLCLQHTDWIFRIRKSYFIVLPIVIVALVSSDMYAIYCLARVFR